MNDPFELARTQLAARKRATAAAHESAAAAGAKMRRIRITVADLTELYPELSESEITDLAVEQEETGVSARVMAEEIYGLTPDSGVPLESLVPVGEVAVMDLRQYVGKVAHARGITPTQAAAQMQIVLPTRRAAAVTE